MKALFKEYLKKSQAEVEPNITLKRQLAGQLFSEKPAKKSFWTWTKAIFTAPVVATFVIIFILSSNQETVKQVLKPQEVLAQALENTFNLDSFERTFGLPDDGKFRYRKLTHTSKGHGEQKLIRTFELWSDGLNIKADVFEAANELKSGFQSYLLNKAENYSCLFVTDFQSDIFEPACETLGKSKINFIGDQGEIFFPVEKETMINKIAFQNFYSKLDGPGLKISFSTSSPIKNPRFQFLDSNFNAISLFSSDALKSSENAKNSYQIQFMRSIVDQGNIVYFQVQDVVLPELSVNEKETLKTASMIYQLDSKAETIRALTPQEFKTKIPINVEYIQFISNSGVLIPAFYMMRYPEYFRSPTRTEEVTYQGKSTLKMTFDLPESFSNETPTYLYPPFAGKSDVTGYKIEVFMDPEQNKFLGYAIKQNALEVEAVTLEDEILPDSEKSKIFNEDQWKKSFTK